MSQLAFQDLGDGVHCVDTGLTRPNHTACYLVEDQGELAFVDMGASRNVPGLLELTSELGAGPGAVKYIIATHIHLDHAGGAGALMAGCPNAKFVVHPKGAPHMIDPARLQAGASAVYGEDDFRRQFGDLVPIDESRVIAAEDGQEFELGERTLTFVHTPGHANHHGCIFDSTARGFYTGDTFGLSYREFDSGFDPWVIATTTPVAFDPYAWENSLKRLMTFDPHCMFLTHYGRVDNPPAQAQSLLTNIGQHRYIALTEEGEEEEGRAERLKQAVDELLVGEGIRRKPDYSEDKVRELLALDIDLNAQGLHVWLQRRARSA